MAHKLKPVGDSNDPQSLYYFLLRFEEHLKILNYAEDTINGRHRAIHRFIFWCDERGLTQPCEITQPILERFARHLFLYRKDNGEPLGASTQQNVLIAIRAWFGWLAQHNHILYNPASEIQIPKCRQRLPNSILTISEAEEIMNCPNLNTDTGIRDRGILEVLYSTGIRRMELCNLKTSDLDTERGTLFVAHGKGDVDRMIPIGDRAITWVRKYVNEVREQYVTASSNNCLFLNKYGNRISRNGLSAIVSNYIRQAGKTGSCHLFRHTMATLMLENGADIRYIQRMLGHARLDTTQVYTHVSISKLKEIHTQTHPARNEPRSKE